MDKKSGGEIIFTLHSASFINAHRPHPIWINQGQRERPADSNAFSTVNSVRDVTQAWESK